MKMKKTVLFVILDQFAEFEAGYLASAIHMLGQDRFCVKTVSLTKEPVCSVGGFRVIPDYDVNDYPSDYAGMILIGGMTWREEASMQAEAFVQDALKKDRILGGICDAAAFLGKTGALNHVRHTGNHLPDLKSWAGEAYTGEENYCMQQAVRDGNIVTANGTAALEFAKEVLLALQAAPEKVIEEWYGFHKLGMYTAPIPFL